MDLSEDSIGYHLIWISLLCVLVYWFTWNLTNSRRMKKCMRPLLSDDNLVDQRIDAAKREAEHGFLPCPACGFENFTRSHCCALCGTRCFDMGPDQAYQCAAPTELSPLQRRARMRKEWQRKVDVEGRMFWFRNTIDDVASNSPAYMIRFHRTEIEHEQPVGSDTVEVEQEPTSPVENNASDDVKGVDKTLEVESEETARELEEAKINPIFDMSDMTFELLESSKLDAAEFPYGHATFSTGVGPRESIATAAKDFPSKFSQFVIEASTLPAESKGRRMKLSIHRDYVVEQSMEHLSCIPRTHIATTMRIKFIGEVAIDAGGLHREWFMAVHENLVTPELGLFKCTNRSDQTYFINPNSAIDNGEDHLIYFYSTGRLVGRALLDGAVLGFHLSVPLLKMILGMPVSFDDLAHYDTEMYRNLKWMVENDGVDALGLDFSVCEKRGDEMVVVDLIPDGRNVAVTDANKQLYLERKFKYTLFESVAEQLCVLLQGLYEVIPPRMLLPFDYEELDYLLCGTSEIDVDDWEKNTRISLNLEDNPRVARWFWEVVREMDREYRRRLLQFSTGCSRVPLVGFKGLTSFDGRLCPFSLKGVQYITDPHIRSHVCFNMLDLPLFATKEALKKNLYATLDTELDGFGFTIV